MKVIRYLFPLGVALFLLVFSLLQANSGSSRAEVAAAQAQHPAQDQAGSTTLASVASAAARTWVQVSEPSDFPVSASTLPRQNAPALDPHDWQNWPIIPALSERMLAVYREGLAMGNNPQAFSKVGDGEISALWFLTDFDLGPQYYDLGSNTELLPAIEYFAGSFGRSSMAARRGFNTSRILDPALANPEFCIPGETPLECELRIHRPSFALVSLGTNQVWAPEVFEPGLRQIVETLLAHGVVPVLSTKADNLEGDYRINAIIAAIPVMSSFR